MASTSRDPDESEGVVFIREDDGSVTAKDLETGLARGGDTRAEALSQLAEVLELHEGGGEPIENPREFLREELDIDPNGIEEDRELPEFMQ
ncbi:MAG: hypothetical protein R3324_10485 [Halobacteriales archaeon]|nr:hypothetical protein [Halobacteriales archaeon]